MRTNGVILAAGLSSRMETFKPFLKLKGKTMIEHSVESMLESGVNQVIVVLGYRGKEVEALFRNKYYASKIVFVHNLKYAQTDMLTSVKIGILALNPCDAFYLLPGDMPAIGTQTFLAVREAMRATNCMVCFPTIDGYRKHPPLIAWRCKEHILKFNQTGGLREVWKQFENQIVTVQVEDFGCTIDADTQEDYERLRHYMN
ncbi:MAG: NTP transferase domain-containing protein [Cellulosilyticaceae bacterium]